MFISLERTLNQAAGGNTSGAVAVVREIVSDPLLVYGELYQTLVFVLVNRYWSKPSQVSWRIVEEYLMETINQHPDALRLVGLAHAVMACTQALDTKVLPLLRPKSSTYGGGPVEFKTYSQIYQDAGAPGPARRGAWHQLPGMTYELDVHTDDHIEFRLTGLIRGDWRPWDAPGTAVVRAANFTSFKRQVRRVVRAFHEQAIENVSIQQANKVHLLGAPVDRAHVEHVENLLGVWSVYDDFDATAARFWRSRTT